MTKIKCMKTHILMEPYINEQITSRDKEFFEEHISTCDKCRGEFETDIRLEEALKSLHGTFELSEKNLEDYSVILHQTIDDELQRKSKFRLNVIEELYRDYLQSPCVVIATIVISVCAGAYQSLVSFGLQAQIVPLLYRLTNYILVH